MDSTGLVFITDAWGTRYGGINSFNKDLCVAMGYVLSNNTKVICLILGDIDEDAKIDALQQNVYLVSYNKRCHEIQEDDYSRIISRISNEIKACNLVLCIGHDIFTGKIAINLSNVLGIKSAIIVHTDYIVIEGLKEKSDGGSTKELEQRDIIEKANFVFAVGPRLQERVLEIRDENAFEIIPGLAEISPNTTKNHRTIMTYGRFEGSIAPVKLNDLACAAFGRAVAMVQSQKDYVLQIFGAKLEDSGKVSEIAKRFAGKRVSVNVNAYTEDRAELFKALQNNCAFMMLSISEGFGLSAWEAIAAEVPLIITKNSGLYDFLYRELGYLINGLCLPVNITGVFYINSIDKSKKECDDIENVAKKLREVLIQPDRLKSSAKLLKESLKKYTWERTAITIANACNLTNISLDSLSYSEDFYDVIYRNRKICMDYIFQKVRDRQIKKHIVFFGGISNRLCKEDAINEFTNLLLNLSNVEIYFCYEKGEVALRRAAELNPKMLPKDDLSQDPMRRMNMKAKKIEDSYNYYLDEIKERVHYIPLSKAPNTYFIILDDDIYFSLLLETRSTNSTTIKIKNNPEAKEERIKMLDHMEFILNETSNNIHVKKLLRIVNEMKNK